MIRDFSHPCPRPTDAADLPSEFDGEWLTPRNSKYIIYKVGYSEGHVEPAEYQAKITGDDELCLTLEGEETCYERVSGLAGEVAGKWNHQGEVYDFQSHGILKTKSASFTNFLTGRYNASNPDASGNFDLETWVVNGSMWIENGKLHWLELLKNDVCSDRIYEFDFDTTGAVLTLTIAGQSYDFTKV